MKQSRRVKSVLLLLICAPLVAADTLMIKTLNLDFNNESQQQVVAKDTELRARLILTYQGSGLLQGSWLLAEPGGTEGKPLFRNIQLVRETIVSSQRSYVDSPELPTLRTGKYLLKFCLTDQKPDNRLETDPRCAQASYQVITK